MKRLVIRPEAEREIWEAAEWYESRRPGLGLDFIATTDLALAGILEAPLRFPLWKEGHTFRKLVLRRFPYVVFYELQAEDVIVLAFAHARRRPGYWLTRRG